MVSAALQLFPDTSHYTHHFQSHRMKKKIKLLQHYQTLNQVSFYKENIDDMFGTNAIKIVRLQLLYDVSVQFLLYAMQHKPK